MALYDAQRGRAIVRIVYDGPALAGKTTNLARLRGCFSESRRSELFSTITVGGRTTYLDWLQIDSGLVLGHPLCSHFLTVPGQSVLARRRAFLLALADAVVFVLEATPDGLKEAQGPFRWLQGYLAGERPDVPLLVQANKQDMPGALTTTEVRHGLRLGDAVDVIGASAERGDGVRETAGLAIRGAANRLRQQAQILGLEGLAGEVGDGQSLLDAIKHAETNDPKSPVDIILEYRTDSVGAPMEEPLIEQALNTGPPLPTADAPSGFVWPSTNGRSILRRIPLEDAERRPTRSDEESHLFEAGIWRLRTSSAQYFSDAEDARRALLLAAREKLQLGSLVPKKTVLSVQMAHDGYWLWTITPWLETIAASLEHATSRDDESAVAAALEAWARALAQSLVVMARAPLSLRLTADHFATVGRDVHYVGEVLRSDTKSAEAGAAIAQPLLSHSKWAVACDRYVDAFEAEVRDNLTAEDVFRLDLVSGAMDALSAQEIRPAASRLLHILERQPSSAR